MRSLPFFLTAFLLFTAVSGQAVTLADVSQSFSFTLPRETPENFARFELLNERYRQNPYSLTYAERVELGGLCMLYGRYFTGYGNSWSLFENAFDGQDPQAITKRPEFTLPTTVERNKERRQKLMDLYIQAYPNIQLLLQVKNFLPTLVETYAAQDSDSTSISQNLLQMLRQNIRDPDKSDYDQKPFPIAFTASLDGRFQVDGIEQDRLAINTGDNILVNVNRLATMTDLTFPKVVQLLLHEYSHLEPSIPLEQRDAWSTKVSQWIQNSTSTWTLKDGSRIISVLTSAQPEPPPKIVNATNYFTPDSYTLFQRSIRKSFLLLKQDQNGTRIYDEVYNAFHTFDNMPGKSLKGVAEANSPDLIFYLWPMVKVQNTHLDPITERLQVSYVQSSRYMVMGADRRSYSELKPSDVEGQMPNLPDVAYRIEHIPSANMTETRIAYGHELADADFEINRLVDAGDRRFVSIRMVKTPEMKTLGKEIHLIAKDPNSSAQISVTPLKIRNISTEELLLHFEIPRRNLEISQIVIPQIAAGDSGSPSELVIRPSQKIQVQGPEVANPPITHVQSFWVDERLPGGLTRKEWAQWQIEARLAQLDLGVDLGDSSPRTVSMKTSSRGDPAILHMKLHDQGQVRGITLDVMHVVTNRKIQWNVNIMDNGLTSRGPQVTSEDELGHTGSGRKYYISNQAMRIQKQGNESHVSFYMPFDAVQKIEVGPEYTDTLSAFYKIKSRLRAASALDTGYREILGAWIHFDDGTVEKIPSSRLPQKRFQTYAPPRKDPPKKPSILELHSQKERVLFCRSAHAGAD